MPFSTAPALLFGLGARLLLVYFTDQEPSVKDFILFGLFQGVALYFTSSKHSDLALVVALGVAAKIVFDYTSSQDTVKCACTLVGIAIGVLATDLLSHYLDPKPRGKHKPSSSSTRKVQFRRDELESAKHRVFRQTISDITSVDSRSELVGPNPSMTPLEREVAALRARASLADSERRRYKEEKKWALSQGNIARASQMSWQVKKYKALMQSFHREADSLIVDATNTRARQTASQEQQQQQHHDTTHDRHTHTRNPSHEVSINNRPGTVSVDIRPSPQRRSSQALNSAIRVNVR